MKNEQTENVTCYPPLAGQMNKLEQFDSDPLGSYNGVPADPKEVPVQDADDL